MTKLLRHWWVCGLLLVVLGMGSPIQAQAETPLVITLTIDGPITPSTSSYISRGLDFSVQNGAQAMVVLLNTPGGEYGAMMDIIEQFEGAPLPVLVYISPRGGGAASAGALIALAAHGVAMAPQTTIGAAHPVDSTGENLPSTMDEKLVNTLVSKMQNLTERRGVAASSWAEAAIRESAVATEDEAVDLNVADLVATDLQDMLNQFDKRTVAVQGRSITLQLRGARVEALPLNLPERLLQFLADPNVLAVLLIVGILAVLVEISTPGGWFAGFLGAVCLALAAYGLGLMPINWLGAAFIAIAFALFVLDIKTPTHGALTTAGLVSMVAGLLIMFNSPIGSPFGQVSIPLVIGLALFSAAIFSFVIAKAVQILRRKPTTGREGLIGAAGTAKTALDPDGIVLVMGERWQATAQDPPIPEGTAVLVTERAGFRLRVRRS